MEIVTAQKTIVQERAEERNTIYSQKNRTLLFSKHSINIKIDCHTSNRVENLLRS